MDSIDAVQPVATAREGASLGLLSSVPIRLSVEVGSTAMRLADILKLEQGSVVALDRQADDLLDIFANGTLIARGEVVGVDGRYGIRLVEIAEEGASIALDRRG